MREPSTKQKDTTKRHSCKIEDGAADALDEVRRPYRGEENAEEVERKARYGGDWQVVRVVVLVEPEICNDQI